MMSIRLSIAAIALAGLTACGTTSDLSVRTSPQSLNPVTGTYERSYAGASVQVVQTEIANVSATDVVGGVTPADVADALFPGASTNSEVSGAVAAFASACLQNSPSVAAIVAEGRRLGFDMNEIGPDAAFGVKESGADYTSLQINMASSYAFECAVTTLVSQNTSAASVRNAFFAGVGQQPTASGSTTVTLNGKSYKLSHEALNGGAFGVNEHAFLLQAN